MSTISSGTLLTTAFNVTSDTSGTLTLQTGASSANAVYIDSSQNVGIGTATAGYGDLTIKRQATTGTYATLSLVSGTAGYGRLFFGNTQNAAGEYDGFVQYDQANRLMQFGTAQTERMRIDSAGNVGIGTNSPNYKTEISAASATNGIGLRITNSGSTGAGVDFLQSGVDNFSLTMPAGAGGLRFIASGSNERMRIDSSGNVLVTNVAGLGYGTGSGGTVTQATNKVTAVTLNKPTGQITTNAAALASGVTVAFTVNNSLVTASDTVIATTAGSIGANYSSTAYGATAGSFIVNLKNVSAGSLSEAVPINFAIIKGATA